MKRERFEIVVPILASKFKCDKMNNKQISQIKYIKYNQISKRNKGPSLSNESIRSL